MSRIGKLPIDIPQGVTITVDSDVVKVSGPKGELSQPLLSETQFSQDDGQVTISRSDDSKLAKSQHGLMRSLIKNMLTGVNEGFSKTLVVKGTGYRISGGGQEVELNLGYSHPVSYRAPDGIELKVDKSNLTVSGADKQQVGQVAAEIRALRSPEPYKGKGVMYEDEQIIQKTGKAGK